MQKPSPYNTVTGIQDSTLVWANGNASAGIKGSVVPYQAFVNVSTEAVNLIQSANLVPNDADLTQVTQAVDHKIATAIAAIPAPVIPTIPTYSGSSGVSIAGTVAQMDINSLVTTNTCTAADYVPVLRNGIDEKIAVQDIATEILSFYHQVIPASVPLPTPASTLTYTFPSDIAIGNNTTAAFPLGNLNGAFGAGDANKFTFAQSGLYTITAFLQLNVVTNYDSNGNSASVARTYASFYFQRNGTQIMSESANGTAYNYVGTLTALFPLTSYFAAGETIAFTGNGTGDSFNANNVYQHAGTFINITKLG